MNSSDSTRVGLANLVDVETCNAFRMPQGVSPDQVLVIAHGRKPSACHRVDIVPARSPALNAFAVIAVQDPGLCIPGDQGFTYSEVTALPQPAESIAVLSRGKDDTKPHIHEVPIQDFEPNSLVRWLETQTATSSFLAASHAASLTAHSGAYRSLAPQDQLSSFARDPSRALSYSSQQSPSPLAIRRSDTDQTDPPIPRPGPLRPPLQPPREGGDFHADVKFWLAGYGRCEVFVERDGQRWVFRGEGGGAPGGGGFTGVINTNNLGMLVSSTTSCSLAGLTFYGTLSFFDANANVLGTFHGGGFGVGGGVYTGSWQ